MNNVAVKPDFQREMLTLLNKGADHWQISNGRLTREFQFKDFAQAFEFMTQIAQYAQATDHHPEWCNSYNRVVVKLITHEQNAITEKDFALAQEMDSCAQF